MNSQGKRFITRIERGTAANDVDIPEEHEVWVLGYRSHDTRVLPCARMLDESHSCFLWFVDG
jgi:hypothetical protein